MRHAHGRTVQYTVVHGGRRGAVHLQRSSRCIEHTNGILTVEYSTVTRGIFFRIGISYFDSDPPAFVHSIVLHAARGSSVRTLLRVRPCPRDQSPS